MENITPKDPKEIKKLRDKHHKRLREACAAPKVITGGCSGMVRGKKKKDSYLKPPREIPEKTKQANLTELGE